jgi:hypothetical protein
LFFFSLIGLFVKSVIKERNVMSAISSKKRPAEKDPGIDAVIGEPSLKRSKPSSSSSEASSCLSKQDEEAAQILIKVFPEFKNAVKKCDGIVFGGVVGDSDGYTTTSKPERTAMCLLHGLLLQADDRCSSMGFDDLACHEYVLATKLYSALKTIAVVQGRTNLDPFFKECEECLEGISDATTQNGLSPFYLNDDVVEEALERGLGRDDEEEEEKKEKEDEEDEEEEEEEAEKE